MRKIKVARLAQYLPDSKHNGVSMHINKITKHLSQRDDIELHLITFGNKKTQLRKGNLTIHMIKKIAKLPESLLIFQIWSLKRKIIEINPDIVHAQVTYPPYSTATALVRNKYPTILTVHGIVAKELKFRRGISFIFGVILPKPNERYVISKILNIIVVFLHAKNLISNMTHSKIHVIPNGVDFEDIQNISPHKSLAERSHILYVGNLVKVKGVDSLIKAIPNIRVFIGGLGLQEKELKKLVKKLNIEESVKFLGFISGNEKYSYYKSTDLCVVPSFYETFGIVCLEAMACGKPIVASNVGGIPYVVENGKTGLLFESGNVKDLAEKIIILLNDKELREKMGEAGRERAKEFTWDRIADKTIALYKAIISEKREAEK